MGAQEVGQAFVDAFNSGDLDTARWYLADDFQLSGPTPQPIGADQWMGLTQVLRDAFPDINYNLRIVGMEGDTVRTTSQVTGTHTGELDLSFMGLGVIPATGRRFSNPEEPGEGVVRGDKIISIHIYSQPGGGLMGILAQLGVQVPGM